MSSLGLILLISCKCKRKTFRKQMISKIIRYPLRKHRFRGTFRGTLFCGTAGRGRGYA